MNPVISGCALCSSLGVGGWVLGLSFLKTEFIYFVLRLRCGCALGAAGSDEDLLVQIVSHVGEGSLQSVLAVPLNSYGPRLSARRVVSQLPQVLSMVCVSGILVGSV